MNQTKFVEISVVYISKYDWELRWIMEMRGYKYKQAQMMV